MSSAAAQRVGERSRLGERAAILAISQWRGVAVALVVLLHLVDELRERGGVPAQAGEREHGLVHEAVVDMAAVVEAIVGAQARGGHARAVEADPHLVAGRELLLEHRERGQAFHGLEPPRARRVDRNDPPPVGIAGHVDDHTGDRRVVGRQRGGLAHDRQLVDEFTHAAASSTMQRTSGGWPFSTSSMLETRSCVMAGSIHR
jgi:hypothetical protein